MTVYQSSGTNPSAYLNGRMLELYNDVDRTYTRKENKTMVGPIALGTVIGGLVISMTDIFSDNGACFLSSLVLGPAIGGAAEYLHLKRIPKGIKRYYQRKLGHNFNEREFQEILDLRRHIAREREAQRRAPVYITSSKKIEKRLFDEYVELKSQSDSLHMSADLRSSDHRRLVLSYHLHQNLPAFANENPAIQLDRGFRIHDTELEARNLESQGAEIDSIIKRIEAFHPEIKAEYAKIFPGKK